MGGGDGPRHVRRFPKSRRSDLQGFGRGNRNATVTVVARLRPDRKTTGGTLLPPVPVLPAVPVGGLARALSGRGRRRRVLGDVAGRGSRRRAGRRRRRAGWKAALSGGWRCRLGGPAGLLSAAGSLGALALPSLPLAFALVWRRRVRPPFLFVDPRPVLAFDIGSRSSAGAARPFGRRQRVQGAGAPAGCSAFACGVAALRSGSKCLIRPATASA